MNISESTENGREPMAQDKICIVDNEPEIIQLLSHHLNREGYAVSWTCDSKEAISLIRKESPDLVILDIVMPGLSGLDLCTLIREEFDMPIIFVSCKNEITDKVLGLSIGGDDYITKPFSTSELIARVKVGLKRRYYSPSQDQSQNASGRLSAGDIVVDLDGYTVTVLGKPMALTGKEFELLVLLMRSPNRVFTPKQIFEHLWNIYGYENDYRTVMVHVSNLRKKIDLLNENRANPIETVRSVGYKFVTQLPDSMEGRLT
jgi:DNA-binding response OmpR family regulator